MGKTGTEDVQKLTLENRELKEELARNLLIVKRFKFIARVVSHDLRSPVVSSLNCLLLSKEIVEDKEIKEYLTTAEEQNRKVLGLIDNILNWARAQLDDMKIQPVNLNLKSLLAETISPQMFSLMSKGINLRYNVKIDTMVFADKNVLQSIIRNLFTNAIKFTHKNGNIHIFIDEDEKAIKIFIKDDGVGMSEKHCKKIFESAGVSSWGTDGESGTGIGLFTIKQLADKAGMILDANSDGEGKGSTFILTIKK